MIARRIPALDAPNEWSRRLEVRRAAGSPLLDLTEANPTRLGLGGAGARELRALGEPEAARYDPDPRGTRPARQAVAAHLARRGVQVGLEDILLTASTSEAYALLFKALLEPGESLLAPLPSYPLFEPLAMAEGVERVSYRLAWEERWALDLPSIERGLAAGARAVIVVQPNHPTGSCLDAAEVSGLEALCLAHGAALISDEVFAEHPWPPRREPLPSLHGGRRVLTCVLGGLSKSCGMPQMKLAWIALDGPEGARRRAMAALEWLADLYLPVSGPVQSALPRLLEAGPAFVVAARGRLEANLAALRAFVTRQPGVSLPAAEGGWAALLRLPGRRTAEGWALDLLDHGVIVHPGDFYDVEEEACVVLSLIVEPAVLAAGLACLESRLAAD
jgi:aspartate/methionine/tyrosine aminotransferase